MVVVGFHASIISKSDRTDEDSPFIPDYEALQRVYIVDAAILWMFPSLIVRNALIIPYTNHDILPPLIVRETRLIVNNTPKIQDQEQTSN